ncbi:hypothetical protein NP233_g4600 [Leucocoprinus birnbaumii]|uniref:Glucose receptor Git3 N-terminal domain-containing protein n=1 Tax=Leucocoprinus birnbaumii TaxID=56174 RepID=A0AAD5VVR6_9AGAR|nr:hypothetical protein NP233_g4600 [Leucocoprinus birnbaumii]
MSEAQGVCSADNDLLSFGARLGVFVTFESSLISAIAVSLVLCYTFYRVVKKIAARRAVRQRNSEVELPPIDATDSLGFLVFMFGELIKAIGGMMNMKWALQGCITENSFCTAQGYIRLIGDVSVSFFSLYIGFDTFFVLVYGWRAPSRVNIGAIIALCLLTVLLAAIGPALRHDKSLSYMGSTIYWCWIRRQYLADQVGLEYLWMWLTALIQLVLYGLMALVMRGVLVVKGPWLRLRTKSDAPIETGSQISDLGDDERENRATANLLLFYPAIHVICVLPLSIVRWKYFAQGVQTSASVLTTSTIFELSGFLNALLYTFSRPDLVSGQNLERPSQSQPITIIPTPADNIPMGKWQEGEKVRRRTAGQGILPPDDESRPITLHAARSSSQA